MFVQDGMNNLRRLCSLRGTDTGRRWQVRAAVAGGRYLVRHVDSGEHRVVLHSLMTNLY